MDPVTATIQLVALTIWKAIDGTELVKSAFSGVVGNRADWAFGRIRQGLLNRWENGQIVNHDIERALHEAYLNATLLACESCLKPLEKSNGLFAKNDNYFSDEAKSLRRIKQYLEGELEKFKDATYVPTEILAVHGRTELLLTQEISGDSATLADQLKGQLLGKIEQLFDANTALEMPDSFRTIILDGWQDGKGRQDWFEWVCGFFHEYLKTRPRLSEILEKQWLANLTIDTQSISVKVGDVEKSLVSMSGQVTELIALVKKLEGKTDELLEYGRLIPIILELLQTKLPTPPARHKYLNRFPHYDLTNFVGRTDELEHIKQEFDRHRLLILQGMGGIGKSTLARAYISRNAGHYEHIAFVEVANTIAQAMFDSLGNSADVGFTYNTDQSADENFTALLEVLRHIPNLLLVLDNANNPTDLLTRKEALESLNATVLITSRARPDRFVVAQQVIPIKALPRPDALRLFTKLYGQALQPDETTLVEAILEKAFYHPKLIEVIVTQIRRNDLLTLNAVKTIVEKKRYNDDEINYPDEADEQAKTIYSILLDLFNTDSLTEEQKQLLRYFAVLPAVDIPVKHLLDLLNITSPDEQRSLTTQLKKLALTAWLDNPSTRYFSIHGLIQWVVSEKLKPTDENCEPLLNETAGLFYRLLSANPLGTQPYLVYGDELLRSFEEDKNGPITTLYNNIAGSYGALGDNQKRLEYDLKALRIREQTLSPTHPDLAMSYANISASYGALGDNQQALEYNLKALRIREQTLSPTHPSLAMSYANIAVSYGALGDNQKRLEYNLKALRIREQTLSPTHPDLATSYANIAVSYGAVGDNQKRLEYNLKALRIREQTLSPTHPDLAMSYANIAVSYGAVGDNQKRLEYNLKALRIREQTLSPTHPDLAMSYANIAVSYGALGDNQKRLEYDLKALRIREQTLSPTHPDLAMSYANIAVSYGAVGDNQKRLDYDLKALAIREAVLPANHPDLASSYNNIAVTYYYIGDLAKALAYMQKAVAIREQILPPTHADLLSSRESLAIIEQAVREQNDKSG